MAKRTFKTAEPKPPPEPAIVLPEYKVVSAKGAEAGNILAEQIPLFLQSGWVLVGGVTAGDSRLFQAMQKG